MIVPAFSPFNPPEPAGFPTRLPDLLPLARGHTAPVLDTAWSPFDDNLVVSAGDDGKSEFSLLFNRGRAFTRDVLTAITVFLWKVEEGMFDGWGEEGWAPQDLEPRAKMDASGR